MNELNYQQQHVQDNMMMHHDHRSFWKRLQPTLRFWLFLFLMLAGITYYRLAVDFMFAPHAPLKQSFENIMTP